VLKRATQNLAAEAGNTSPLGVAMTVTAVTPAAKNGKEDCSACSGWLVPAVCADVGSAVTVEAMAHARTRPRTLAERKYVHWSDGIEHVMSLLTLLGLFRHEIRSLSAKST
jgi:hypothetical protein